MRLDDIRYLGGRMSYPSRKMTAPEWILPDYLEEARKILDAAEGVRAEDVSKPEFTRNFEQLRWFPLSIDLVGIAG